MLGAQDAVLVRRWTSNPSAADADEGGADDPPLLLRLSHLAESLTERVDDVPASERVAFFRILDAVLADGDQPEKDAVATGFLESLMAAADRGFDLRRVWHELGPRSQQYCRDWNAFTGERPSDFMRPA
ncbi:hypothetical protein FHG89_02590 [Micromonospora orduensis]|uniref:Uncharacterized protein n=1 Tax=Micromonospora orduensis TaxID=1420891 RepID=A0A5C4QZ28_9ACTN|nr:hypothetical protein [Micromonospora orduensis]TNH31358.1 hypothetical protein FHG89_02590 [Micromonospora orduensis]